MERGEPQLPLPLGTTGGPTKVPALAPPVVLLHETPTGLDVAAEQMKEPMRVQTP